MESWDDFWGWWLWVIFLMWDSLEVDVMIWYLCWEYVSMVVFYIDVLLCIGGCMRLYIIRVRCVCWWILLFCLVFWWLVCYLVFFLLCESGFWGVYLVGYWDFLWVVVYVRHLFVCFEFSLIYWDVGVFWRCMGYGCLLFGFYVLMLFRMWRVDC